MNTDSTNKRKTMPVLRSVVALAVALPLLVYAGWPHPWYVTFFIACIAFGVGAAVEAVAVRSQSAEAEDDSAPNELPRRRREQV
jgi:hypothetical protein